MLDISLDFIISLCIVVYVSFGPIDIDGMESGEFYYF